MTNIDPLTGEPLARSTRLATDEQQPPPPSVAPVVLDNLLDMDRNALKQLLQKVLDAGWGFRGLTGRDLIEACLKSEDELYESLLLTGYVMAKNATDWREYHALATFWSERKRGKPSGSAPQVNIGATGDMQVRVILIEPGEQVKQIEG